MKTLINISWRNVWRNPMRSIVIMLAVAFGLWGGIMSTAITGGVVKQYFKTSLERNVSHIQIHNPEYLNDKNVKFAISNPDKIISVLNAENNVLSFSKRSIANGMISTASMSNGIDIMGIDPEMESKTTEFSKNIIEGSYFEENIRNPILVSEKLAKKMKIEMNSRIVMTFQDVNGEFISASFKVSGIYRTSNTMLDERRVYLKISDLNTLLGDSSNVTEIAILMKSINEVDSYRDKLKSQFPNTVFQSWQEIAPDLAYTQEMSAATLWVLIVIILFALAFGLLNTMLMAVFERTREIGVLMSVGMNKSRIFFMIMLETTFITLSGAFTGMLLGIISIAILSKTGIDFSKIGGDSLSDYGIDAIVYPQIEVSFFFQLTLLVLITAVLSSIYPARKALKLNPAEAVRKE